MRVPPSVCEPALVAKWLLSRRTASKVTAVAGAGFSGGGESVARSARGRASPARNALGLPVPDLHSKGAMIPEASSRWTPAPLPAPIPSGLGEEEAARRLAATGPNEL